MEERIDISIARMKSRNISLCVLPIYNIQYNMILKILRRIYIIFTISTKVETKRDIL